MNKYVIKNNRLKDFLYSLGFNYSTVEDKTRLQKEVYLFPNIPALMDAITYYTNFKKLYNISKN